MKKIISIIMCICLIIPAVNVFAINRSKEIYVSSKGVYCDYTTISDAVAAAGPGITIYVRDGVYREEIVFEKSGTVSQPITLKAYGKNAVIRGTIRLSDYITLDGLIMDGEGTTRSDAINVPGDGNRIVNMTVKNYIGSAVGCSSTRNGNLGSQNTYIAGNYVENCGGGFVLGDNSVLENNTMNGVNTFNTTAITGDFCRAMGNGIIIRGNLYYGTKPENLHRPGTDDVHADFVQAYDDNAIECANVLIENNRAYGFYHQGVMLENDYYGPQGEFYLHDWTIRNNLFAGFSSWGVCGGKTNGGIPNLNIYNNTFVGYTSEGYTAWNGVGVTGIMGTGCIVNNIFAGLFASSYFVRDGAECFADYNLIYEAPAPTVSGPHDLMGSNPEFKRYSFDYTLDEIPGADFSVSDVSPCIDRGYTTDAKTDINGNLRPQNLAHDIGAYEFTGTPGNTAPVMRLTGIENGAVLKENQTVKLVAEAEDADGIREVEFWYDGELLKKCTELPFEAELITKKADSSTVYAVVYDNSGLSTTSAHIQFFITDQTSAVCETVWNNYSFPTQRDVFSVEFSVVPMMGGTNAVLGFSEGEAAAYTKMVCGIRAYPGDVFEARDYDAYKADTVFNYEAGKFYDVRMDVDIPNKLYDVYIAERGKNAVCIARDYRFRAQSDIINNWFTYCESGSARIFGVDFAKDNQSDKPLLHTVLYTPGKNVAEMNGVIVDTGEAVPEISDGVSMLPVDLCESHFGAVCEINGDNVYFELNDVIFESDIGSQFIMISGEKVLISHPLFVKNNQVCIPLRQIFEAAGYTVEWNEATSGILITLKSI